MKKNLSKSKEETIYKTRHSIIYKRKEKEWTITFPKIIEVIIYKNKVKIEFTNNRKIEIVEINSPNNKVIEKCLLKVKEYFIDIKKIKATKAKENNYKQLSLF